MNLEQDLVEHQKSLLEDGFSLLDPLGVAFIVDCREFSCDE